MTGKRLKAFTDYSLLLIFILFLGYLFFKDNPSGSWLPSTIISLIGIHGFINFLRIYHVLIKIKKPSRVRHYLTRESSLLGLFASGILVVSTESRWAVALLLLALVLALIIQFQRVLQSRRMKGMKNKDLLDN